MSWNQETVAKIHDEIRLIKQAQGPYSALFAPTDENAMARVSECVERIKNRKPTLLMLVGIGGSNMGTLAIIQAVLGTYHNHRNGMKFYCADTIDDDVTSSLLSLFEQELTTGGEPVLCIITKSGTTAETIINGALFLELFKKYRPETYHKGVVIITDPDSPLVSIAHGEGYELLEIPKPIGGRFSIFTAVGLFPLMLLGIDFASFCARASTALERCMNKDFESNDAFITAQLLYENYHKGFLIHDIFVFSPDLMMLGNWYKQLIGESLGKKQDRDGATVEVGMTPTVSLGTVDLHSVAQLYLAGPRNRITSFLFRSGEPKRLVVPESLLSATLPELSGKSITAIKHAVFQGVVAAYKLEKRPFMIRDLGTATSGDLGEWMMTKMVETIFLARLFSINAFDQPAVELYKKQARSIIGA